MSRYMKGGMVYADNGTIVPNGDSQPEASAAENYLQAPHIMRAIAKVLIPQVPQATFLGTFPDDYDGATYPDYQYAKDPENEGRAYSFRYENSADNKAHMNKYAYDGRKAFIEKFGSFENLKRLLNMDPKNEEEAAKKQEAYDFARALDKEVTSMHRGPAYWEADYDNVTYNYPETTLMKQLGAPGYEDQVPVANPRRRMRTLDGVNWLEGNILTHPEGYPEFANPDLYPEANRTLPFRNK